MMWVTQRKDTKIKALQCMHTQTCMALRVHARTHTSAHPQTRRKSTHRISKSRRARKAPSSMQLIWLLSSCLQEGRERVKACLIATLPWSTMSSASLSPRCPSTPLQSLLVIGRKLAGSLPRCSVSSHWLSKRAAYYSTLKPVRSR